MELTPRVAALKALLDAMPGATFDARCPPRSERPNVLLYKIMGKMFAILEIRGIENVILKCDPYRAEMLRETFEGVGRRSHLDPRFWISVRLDMDVDAETVAGLVAHSHDQVRAGLTKKQQAELAAIAGEANG